jgi:hypothetical protein
MTETQKRVRRAVADLLDSTFSDALGEFKVARALTALASLATDSATLAEVERELATISEELRAKADG